MKTYTEIELKAVLELHLKWWEDKEGGQRADLRGADLRGADLRDADLRGADLRGANLRDADFRGADLRDINLQDADLRGADLRDADLQDADLRGADLRGADLQGAELQHADLQRANLQDANLWGADLRGTNLDFSCLPLWCGGSKFKASARLVLQILAHVSTITVDDADDELKPVLAAIKAISHKSHRARDLGIRDEALDENTEEE